MTGEYHFGVAHGRLTAREVRRRVRIATTHNSTFTYMNVPGSGWRSWFTARSYGAPFDDALAARVLDAVER